MRLLKRGYMINENENEAENDKQIKQICGINRSRSRHGLNILNIKCLSVMIAMCAKQHLKLNSWKS